MGTSRRLLWVADDPVPANVAQATEDRWTLRPYRPDQPLLAQLRQHPLALICPNGRSGDPQFYNDMLADLEQTHAVGVFLLPPAAQAAWDLLARRGGQFLCAPDDLPADRLADRLDAAAQLQPVIRSLRTEVESARELGQLPAGSLGELTEEMRLAARLQRDFLPRRMPEVAPLSFGVLFRPASWVSGDIYDVVRLDETHVGFYVADAVGHGLPAALLTMFIKRALQTKRIQGNTYQIVPPDVSLRELNDDICGQGIASCQFCTAAYCVVDVSTLTLMCARAGHPEPIILHADGSTSVVDAPGALLGVFPEETYEPVTVGLSPGDRVLLYSDGAEFALRDLSHTPGPAVADGVREWLGVARDEMILRLCARIDDHRQEVPLDDITILVADIAG